MRSQSYLALLTVCICFLISYVSASDDLTDDLFPKEASAKPSVQVRADLLSAFVASFSMIAVSEIGDKTFFIAALMAMRHPRIIILSGALGALFLMTVLSAGLGFALPNFLPRSYTHYAAALLFGFFGVKLIKEAYFMEPSEGPSEELEEVEAELAKKDQSEAKTDLEAQQAKDAATSKQLRNVLIQAFTLTFLAEWGDRSQITTIALAAAQDFWGVVVGACLGHAMCTGVAVVGGRMLATKISERTVNWVGGVLFLIFALHSFIVGPEEMILSA